MKLQSRFILMIVVLCSASFFIGLFWHTILVYTKRIKPTKLTCYGLNTFSETYQLDCYTPIKQRQLVFTFKNHLNCKLLTNTQFSNTGDQMGWETENVSIPVYNNILFIKVDYSNFTLDINNVRNEVVGSFDSGELHKDPYVIVQNDERIVNAIRKTNYGQLFNSYGYEYITVSKKTGKGIKMWVNTEDQENKKDSVGSEFFQCE